MSVWTRTRAGLPAVSWRRVLSTMGVGLLLAGAWSLHEPAWDAVRGHPYFRVKEMVIRGTGPLLSAREVRAWLGTPDPLSVWDASPVQMRKRLESHPLIDRATVERQFPDRLEIDVRERRPEAIALLDRLYYVDRSGRLLTPLDEAHGRDYPVITGLLQDTAPGYRTWAFRRAMRLLRLCTRMECATGVSEVHLDQERGVEIYPVYPKVSLILGWGSWREKLTRAVHVLDAWNGYTDRLASVDARYRNQVIVKLRAPLVPSDRTRSGRKVGI